MGLSVVGIIVVGCLYLLMFMRTCETCVLMLLEAVVWELGDGPSANFS